MSLKTQAKVLRVLQEQVVEPVGGTSSVQVDVRVLAATNKDLPAEIRAGAVPRGSLLPPERHPDLRAAAARPRQDDIPLLAEHFMAELAREYGRRPKRFDAGRGGRRCSSYRWPGNVRELRNVIERLMIMVPGDTITLGGSGVPRRRRRRRRATSRGAPALPLHEARERFERDYILRALAAQQGNMSRTAECSASSAATSTARCARSGSRRRAKSREDDEAPAER